jgi:hypothetical protein
MPAAEQERFIAALCDPGASLPEGLLSPAGTTLADRFAVYRNNVHVSLVDCLAQSFPIVHAQVGDEFFHAMARAYVQNHKPTSPQLIFYGDEFPDFIAGFEPAASLPWLRDLARLERAWSACWAAADDVALSIAALRNLQAGELATARIRAHPAAHLIRSAWPVGSLWQAHQLAQPDLSTLEWHPQNVLLTRPQAEVRLRVLDDSAARFTSALLDGESVEAAASVGPHIEAGTLLAQLLADGMILEIRP